jgi:hypothetical protein
MWNWKSTFAGPALAAVALFAAHAAGAQVTSKEAGMAAKPQKAEPTQWERTGRVTVHDSPLAARYPSIARTADGTLLVLFTRSTAPERKAGTSGLVLVRSTDAGETWSEPVVLYQGQSGEPRAVGTMTTLARGEILAPFAELDDARATSNVRILRSSDAGRSWEVSAPDVTIPLSWWAPRGRIIEAADGTLVMPVYGAASQEDLKATIHGCALLRSRDRGKTWTDFTCIVKGPAPIIGAHPDTRFSFEGPALQVLGDGRWVALVTARRLNASGDGPSAVNQGPGAPLVLCRLWSTDEGRTWTPPDQLTPGAWPGLAAAGGETLCANTLWAAWGEMRLLASRDGLRTLYQEDNVTTREWVRGMRNRPHETPLPPTVPYLAKEWPYEHYGFPSILPVDEDNLIVVFGRTQRGTVQIDGPESLEIPYEKERIQAVFFRRAPVEGELAPPVGERPARPAGRWVLSERIVIRDLQALAQMPGGDLVGKVQGKMCRSSDAGRTWKEMEGAHLPEGVAGFAALRSGRWLAATISGTTKWKGEGPPTKMGMVRGYPTFKLSGQSYDCSVVVWRSDDEGKTWLASPPFKGPFKWALMCSNRFLESADGTVAVPIFGCVTDEEMDSYSASNGVIRSRDRGETWADFSFINRARPKGPDEYQPEPRYSEMDVVELASGHWVAFSRHERITMGPKGWGATEVKISADRGRTWRKSGGILSGVGQQTAVVLPDRGIAFTYSTDSWQAPGVAVSYDEGRTFDYLLTGPYETFAAFASGPDEFVVFTATSHRSDSSAGIYRWVPSEEDVRIRLRPIELKGPH